MDLLRLAPEHAPPTPAAPPASALEPIEEDESPLADALRAALETIARDAPTNPHTDAPGAGAEGAD